MTRQLNQFHRRYLTVIIIKEASNPYTNIYVFIRNACAVWSEQSKYYCESRQPCFFVLCNFRPCVLRNLLLEENKLRALNQGFFSNCKSCDKCSLKKPVTKITLRFSEKIGTYLSCFKINQNCKSFQSINHQSIQLKFQLLLYFSV